MANIPFPPAVELNKQLAIEATPLGARMRRSDGRNDGLPGQPRIATYQSRMLEAYLVEEHSTAELDILAPKLWLVCTRRNAVIHAACSYLSGLDTSIFAHIALTSPSSTRTPNHHHRKSPPSSRLVLRSHFHQTHSKVYAVVLHLGVSRHPAP